MIKKTELLMCHGNTTPDKRFLLEYQRYILITLEKEGILNRMQLEECILRLQK